MAAIYCERSEGGHRGCRGRFRVRLWGFSLASRTIYDPLGKLVVQSIDCLLDKAKYWDYAGNVVTCKHREPVIPYAMDLPCTTISRHFSGGHHRIGNTHNALIWVTVGRYANRHTKAPICRPRWSDGIPRPRLAFAGANHTSPPVENETDPLPNLRIVHGLQLQDGRSAKRPRNGVLGSR
jgi:hypothetical protein